MNPNLFPTYPPDSSFAIMQQHAQLQQLNANLSDMSISDTKQNMRHPLMNMVNNADGQQRKLEGFEVKSHSSDQPIDKRLMRTTVLPEQLDYLAVKYQIESRPSSEMMLNMAREVGLKKGMVENWFKIRRARERNGQYRMCPFCPDFFQMRSALESHLTTKHAFLPGRPSWKAKL